MRALSVATLLAALSGFFILYAASWALPPEQASIFLAYWGIFFALTGLVDGVMQETTRAVSSGTAASSASTVAPDNADVSATTTMLSAKQVVPARRQVRPIQVGLVIGLVVAALIAVTGLWWMPTITNEFIPGAILLMAGGIISYTLQAVVGGVASGLKLWTPFAWLVAVDSLIRVVIVVAAWIFGWGLPVFFIATVIGALTWVGIVLLSPATRAGLAVPADKTRKTFIYQVLAAMAATGATATLITGFPAFIKATAGATTTTAQGVTVAGIMLAVMLTRAPILVPLQRFQPALIVRFVDGSSSPWARLAVPLGAVLGLSIVGAVLAALIGPWILKAFFAPGMFVPGSILAVLTLGAGATGMLMVTGCFALAQNQHGRYVAGWAVASAVAFACLLLPMSLVTAVATALIAGPVAGVVIHLSARYQ